MMNGERKEGICRLNVDGNGCDYLRILSDLETKLRNNTNPKEKIELALQGALMFYGADRAYVIEVDDELGTVAQRLVNPAPVVKQHVFRNRIRRLFARPEILPVEPFHLQRLEERLGTGIIIRRARAAHTLYSADFLNFVPEIPRCILAAAIGVDYQFSLRPSVHYRVSKRSYRKPTVQHTAYCPANYSPAEQVYECAQIQPSFVSRHIREIRYPFLIRLVCLEILPQQILKWLCFRVGYGCT